MKLFLRLFTLAAAMAVIGCGGGKKDAAGVKVTGTITQAGGKALPGGRIEFHPASGSGNVASAFLKSDGTYEANIPPGDYKVAVENSQLKGINAPKAAGAETMPGSEAGGTYVPINAKYTKPDTSGLTVTVPSGGTTFSAELK